MEETVTISKKEYDDLLADSKFLSLLEMFGVDNWEGYDEAKAEFRNMEVTNESKNKGLPW